MSEEANPKDVAGSLKVDLSLLPAAGVIHGAHACGFGAAKYGPYNWRHNKIRTRSYIAAAQRHLAAFLDGEECAPGEAHHLGHAIATLAILLDAIETGNLVDDRPPPGAAAALLARLTREVP